jgi:hypothetical protein
MQPDNGRPSRLTSAMISDRTAGEATGGRRGKCRSRRAPDAGVRKKIPVDNPAQLYGF